MIQNDSTLNDLKQNYSIIENVLLTWVVLQVVLQVNLHVHTICMDSAFQQVRNVMVLLTALMQLMKLTAVSFEKLPLA